MSIFKGLNKYHYVPDAEVRDDPLMNISIGLVIGLIVLYIILCT